MGKFTEKTAVRFAEKVAKLSANSACLLLFYQEKLPERLREKYGK